jgi:hypothetical protein
LLPTGSRRWDGGNKDVFLAQDYGEADTWRLHFDYLLPLFRHPNYIKVQARPLFTFWRASDIGGGKGQEMIALWRQWAEEAGFPPGGLFFLQTLNGLYHETVNYIQPFVVSQCVRLFLF